MISNRYARELCVLVTFALVPVVLHTYIGATVTDGRTAHEVPTLLAGFVGQSTDRDEAWGRRRFESDDWIERRYAKDRQAIALTVIRSFDLKRLYHHPELDIAYGVPFSGHEVRHVAGRPEIPLHLLRNAPGRSDIAIYVLHYDGRFIADPVTFQLRTAGELLVSRRRPMTLIFAHGPSLPVNQDVGALPVTQVLLAATDAFVSQHVIPKK